MHTYGYTYIFTINVRKSLKLTYFSTILQPQGNILQKYHNNNKNPKSDLLSYEIGIGDLASL